jgi:hypothetical protein
LGKSTASIAFQDDDGITHTNVLQDAYYFPDSPVTILSLTAFANQLDDDDGTWIQTCQHQSIFQWDHGKFQCQFYHPLSGVPELPLEPTTTSTADKLTSFMNTFTSAVLTIHASAIESGTAINNHSHEALDFLPGGDDMAAILDNTGPAQTQIPLKSCLKLKMKDDETC